jgi:serine/threonine protein kinase
VQGEVTVEAGREVGRTFVVRIGQTFVIGRGEDVTIPLDDDRISRRHATLEMRPDGLYVADLRSRNGSFLLGRPLAPLEPVLTAPGDIIEIGNHRLRVDVTGLDEKTRRERARTQRLDEPLLPKEEFEILGEIGRGATGRVYAARQKLLNRTVALKVLRSDLDIDDEGRERFLREGRICCKIDSPYVVDVFDVRIVFDRAYLIMELVNGPSVKDRLAGGPLLLHEVVKIAEDVARALEAAHKVGVIHRDIKPANILLTPQGPAKLSDFGIAKELDSLESLTSTGEGLGTLAYVSPEQATEAKNVDPRTDIYGLGATLYHMLAGRPPYQPANARVLLDILDASTPPTPLLRLRPDCPIELSDLVHHMLQKVPSARPQSASVVVGRLAALRARFAPPPPVLSTDTLSRTQERSIDLESAGDDEG